MDEKKIAIPEFNNRVSPLFDVAGQFLIYAVKENDIVKNHSINTLGLPWQMIIKRLTEEKTDILICSAISRCMINQVVANGISVIPGIIGSTDDVIEAYLNDKLQVPHFKMPGCVRGRNGRGSRKMKDGTRGCKEGNSAHSINDYEE